jgi:hypothetical protein
MRGLYQFGFTSRFLVTDLINGHSSAFVLTLPSGEYAATELSSRLDPLITLRHGPRLKHSSFIVDACLPCGLQETTLLLLRALLSNSRRLQSHRLATGLYATILRGAENV